MWVRSDGMGWVDDIIRSSREVTGNLKNKRKNHTIPVKF